MDINLNEILDEITELNGLDNKTLPERVIKFNEEFGEFNAEVGKLIGITHKPYDKPHLLEESADYLQNTFSVLIDTCQKAGFTMEDVFAEIKVKNQKWRAKAPLYTKNNIPTLDLKLETKIIEGCEVIKLKKKKSFMSWLRGF